MRYTYAEAEGVRRVLNIVRASVEALVEDSVEMAERFEADGEHTLACLSRMKKDAHEQVLRILDRQMKAIEIVDEEDYP